jgi:putative ABC transport system permease protein
MLRNYFLTAWRNLIHNKAYSALNILGLAVGMGIALLIGLWVQYQYNYDRTYAGYEQVYKAHISGMRNGEKFQIDASCLPMSQALRNEIPEIEYAVHTDWMNSRSLVAGDNKVYLDGAMAERDFFKVFPCTAVKGNLTTALKEPYSIVLTQSTAKALFRDADPIGKMVRIDNQHDVAVTAVINDVPDNSTVKFNYVVPFDYLVATDDWVRNANTTWDNNSFQTFVRLRPHTTYAQIEPKLKLVYFKYVPDARQYQSEIFFQPMKDWHLYSDFKNGAAVGGFIEYVRLFTLIGALVLLIACVNFTNLATARSEKRAREVGVRKAVGSLRRDLIAQFLIESLVITFFAALLGLLLVQLALPSFNLLTRSSILMPWASGGFWALMVGYVLLTGLIAGSRPAFYLSSFQPIKVLKGAIQVGRSAMSFGGAASPRSVLARNLRFAWSPRKVLVVLQFSCSIALIISSFLIYQQIQYGKERPTGYNSDRLVMTDGSPDLTHNYPALREEVLHSGLVESITRSSSVVTHLNAWYMFQDFPGKLPDETMVLPGVRIGDDYFKTIGMQLVAGKTFTGNYAVDSSYVILNEAAVKRMRLKDPINQVITWNLTSHFTVIGVVKDALMQSPFDAVTPTFFMYNPDAAGNITYRLSRKHDVPTTIASLGKIFNKYNPAYPYLYQFVDESYAEKFTLETLIGRLSALFAGLAIFISCLGLFGLAAYTAEQRTREIGIRKVLGASVSQLWLLLSKDFILLVLISVVVASPAAFYFLQGWLQKYTYRITIGPGVFLAAAAMALLITVLTISFQAIKGALANPTRSLRSE